MPGKKYSDKTGLPSVLIVKAHFFIFPQVWLFNVDVQEK